MGFLSKAKKYVKSEYKHYEKKSSVAREARREAEIKEAARYETQRAKIRTDQRLKAARQPRQGGGMGGFMDALAGSPRGKGRSAPAPAFGIGSVGLANAAMGRKPAAPKKKRKKSRQIVVVVKR